MTSHLFLVKEKENPKSVQDLNSLERNVTNFPWNCWKGWAEITVLLLSNIAAMLILIYRDPFMQIKERLELLLHETGMLTLPPIQWMFKTLPAICEKWTILDASLPFLTKENFMVTRLNSPCHQIIAVLQSCTWKTEIPIRQSWGGILPLNSPGFSLIPFEPP